MGGGREGAAGEHLEGAVSPAEEGTLGEMPLGEGTLGGRGGRPRCSRRRATGGAGRAATDVEALPAEKENSEKMEKAMSTKLKHKKATW